MLRIVSLAKSNTSGSLSANFSSKGRQRWDNDRIKRMLKNETYAGIRHFNRMIPTPADYVLGGWRGHEKKLLSKMTSVWPLYFHVVRFSKSDTALVNDSSLKSFSSKSPTVTY